MQKLANSTIDRIYKCTNDDCGCSLLFTQKLSENFKKKCPLCHKRSLVITSASLSISVMVDLNKPKTFGAQSEKNLKDKEKELGYNPYQKKKPFWRKKSKIDFTVLNNPGKYISEGRV